MAETRGQFTCSTNADDTLTITGYTGPAGAVVIPTNINGLTVSGIGELAFGTDLPFHPSTSLTSITIPGSVTSIGTEAFAECAGLTNVTLANGLVSIEDEAFYDCTGLSNVTIPSSVTNLGEVVFEACTRLTSIQIPASIPNIGIQTFEGCDSLTNVVLTNGLGNIDQFAFQGSAFTSIAIPDTVTNIGYGAFSSCGNLTSVTIPPTVASIGDETFYDCQSLTNAIIASGVSNIAYEMFDTCTNLTSVFFQGNAPSVVGDGYYGLVFDDDSKAVAYYLPGKTGWSNTYWYIPAVEWNPAMPPATMHNGQFGVTVTGNTNIPIQLQACTNLNSPAWMPLTNVSLTDGSFYYSEPVQSNSPSRFYRVVFP